MDEVFQVVWENRVSIICIFDYYACLGGGFDGTLSLNPYTEFAEDCTLASKASKFCKKSDLDRAFIAADAASNRLSGEEKAAGGANRGKALSPDEFILCLVNIAILRYVHEGTISDVSDAVGEDGGTNECRPHTALPPRARAPTHSLIRIPSPSLCIPPSCHQVTALFQDILPKVDPAALQPPNSFRTAYCYYQEADACLRYHERSLTVL